MGKKVSKAGKGTFARYRSTNAYATNKRRKLERHLKAFPTDKTAEKCLKVGLEHGFKYKRETPKTKQWTKTDKRAVQMWTELGHTGTEYKDFLKKIKGKITAIIAPKVGKSKEATINVMA